MSTFRLRWPCKYRIGSEEGSSAGHRGEKDPVAAGLGESVSGAERGGEKWLTKMMTPTKTRRATASGREWCHGFERSTRRTRVQEEQAR